MILVKLEIKYQKSNLMHTPGCKKNRIILYLGEHFPQYLQRSYSQGEKKNSMHDFGLQESESHLAFKLCNFLTDDWEKNKEAANSQ